MTHQKTAVRVELEPDRGESLTERGEHLFVAVDRATGLALRVRERSSREFEGLMAATTAEALEAALVKMFGDDDWLRIEPRFEIRLEPVSGPIIDVTVLDEERWRLAGEGSS